MSTAFIEGFKGLGWLVLGVAGSLFGNAVWTSKQAEKPKQDTEYHLRCDTGEIRIYDGLSPSNIKEELGVPVNWASCHHEFNFFTTSYYSCKKSCRIVEEHN